METQEELKIEPTEKPEMWLVSGTIVNQSPGYYEDSVTQSSHSTSSV